MSNTKDLVLCFVLFCFFLAFFRCDEPVTVTIDVKVEKENVEWSHVFTSGDEIPVPGLAYSAGIADAGLFVKVELQEGDGKLTLKV